jgi:hypothetical protein
MCTLTVKDEDKKIYNIGTKSVETGVSLGEVLYGGVADQVQGEQARSCCPGRALESFEALQWNLKKDHFTQRQ